MGAETTGVKNEKAQLLKFLAGLLIAYLGLGPLQDRQMLTLLQFFSLSLC
jgi:hypothetical protein